MTGTGPCKRMATPRNMCHCPFPPPPAPCLREQTVRFCQPRLFSKQLALQGGPAVSGPYQTGASAHLEENRGGGGKGSLKLVLAGAWGPRGWNFRGRGFASGLQECPSVGNGAGPFVAKGLAGIKITGSSSIGWERTEVFPLQDSEEIIDTSSNPGSPAYCDSGSHLMP